MKIVLGIDPGLASTGYGVIACEGSRYRHVGHGTIRTEPQDSMGARLLQIYDQIREVLDTYRPAEAGIEAVNFSRNSRSAIPVAQAKGVLMLALAEHAVPFTEYTPQELKQAVVGRGKSDKRQIQEVLRILFKLEDLPRPNHAADALAVAFCHANYSSVRALIGG